MKAKSGHRQKCKCVGCAGPNPIKLVEATIKAKGFAAIPVIDIGLTYTVGMCKGEKNGFEFVCTGLKPEVALSTFLALHENLDFVTSMIRQAESQNSDTLVFQNLLQYKNRDGEKKLGPITIVKITEEHKENLAMHNKYYKHWNFSGWQCLICDVDGKAAFDEGYDTVLIMMQEPLFELKFN